MLPTGLMFNRTRSMDAAEEVELVDMVDLNDELRRINVRDGPWCAVGSRSFFFLTITNLPPLRHAWYSSTGYTGQSRG